MNKLIMLASLFTINCFANGYDSLPAGNWEGYRQVGSTYQTLSLSIDSSGNGFYRIIPNLKETSIICFPVSKKTLQFENGFFQQTDEKNGLEFILLLSPSIDDALEVMTIMRFPARTSSFSQSLTLIPVNESSKNKVVFRSCEETIK